MEKIKNMQQNKVTDAELEQVSGGVNLVNMEILGSVPTQTTSKISQKEQNKKEIRASQDKTIAGM